MTFIYLTGFKEKTQKEPRCATVAHMVLTWAPGKYVLDCHKKTPMATSALLTLIKAIKLMPYKQDKIKVITNNHELAWDMAQVLANNAGEFIPQNQWQKFISTLADNNMSLKQFAVSETGMMLSSEKDLARQQVAQTSWGFAL